MQATENMGVISAFLMRHIKVNELSPHEDIFAAGYVNSLFALQLVTFVEKSFQIRIDDEDLDPANFCSVEAIAGFVRRKSLQREEAT